MPATSAVYINQQLQFEFAKILHNNSLLCPSLPCRMNLVTTRMLDFDNTTVNQTYTLTVTVNDTVHEDTIIVDVVVMDLNDNNPIFENATYQYVVNSYGTCTQYINRIAGIFRRYKN